MCTTVVAHLSLSRDHLSDLEVSFKLALCDAFKCLVEVRLHSSGLFCLTQYFQQLIIGQKEEPGEVQPLHLKVVTQTCVSIMYMYKVRISQMHDRSVIMEANELPYCGHVGSCDTAVVRRNHVICLV